MSSAEEDPTSPTPEAGGVPKSLISKILKKGENDTPLTTKAYRDLQKAQKARVYSKTLIRIK